MKRILICASALLVSLSILVIPTVALTHTVVSGDTMWKLASTYHVGVDEIKSANARIVNPDLIYPGDVLTIPETDSAVRQFETEVIRLVNEIRASYGLTALTENWELSRVARYKSEDMAANGYFSHTSPTYGSPFEMMRAFGLSYRSAGENIAKGQSTPKAVVDAWMNSSGHRANILNAGYKKIGVGYSANGKIWTQMFIG